MVLKQLVPIFWLFYGLKVNPIETFFLVVSNSPRPSGIKTEKEFKHPLSFYQQYMHLERRILRICLKYNIIRHSMSFTAREVAEVV